MTAAAADLEGHEGGRLVRTIDANCDALRISRQCAILTWVPLNVARAPGSRKAIHCFASNILPFELEGNAGRPRRPIGSSARLHRLCKGFDISRRCCAGRPSDLSIGIAGFEVISAQLSIKSCHDER